MSRKSRTRRKRRQARAALLHGREAKPHHVLKSGRTGQVHTRKLKAHSKHDGTGIVTKCKIKFGTHEPLEELKYSSASEAVASMRKRKK